jgi:hypothetical protein
MCIAPRFSLIDSYLWFHLFSNYLYLVALLNMKVSYTFGGLIGAYHGGDVLLSMKDKLKTICMFFLMV